MIDVGENCRSLVRGAKRLLRPLKSKIKRAAESVPTHAAEASGPAREHQRTGARVPRAREAAGPEIWEQHFNTVFAFADWAAEAQANHPVDVCICHDSFALEAARSTQARTNCQLIYDAVEYPDYGGRFGVMARAFQETERGLALVMAHERQISQRAELILVGTRGVQEWYVAQAGYPSVEVVRNCLDFQLMPCDTRIRADCNLGPEDNLILSPNSLQIGDYADSLFDALSFLPSNVHMATMGNVPVALREEVVKRLSGAGTSSRLHFLPLRHPKDLLEYRSGADLAVVPLDPTVPVYRSALPNRIFESVMCRHPLVVSDLPYIRELVEEYGCGAVFESSEPRAIASALRKVLDDLPYYKERVDLAANELNWGNERRFFLEAVGKVLGERKPLEILCVANKRLTTNRRVFRHARTLAEEGHNVRVMSLYPPLAEFRDERIEYAAMNSDDPLVARLT